MTLFRMSHSGPVSVESLLVYFAFVAYFVRPESNYGRYSAPVFALHSDDSADRIDFHRKPVPGMNLCTLDNAAVLTVG